MCGIIGINSNKPVRDRLLESLHRLEYRGYDSAGIACIDGDSLHIAKSVGKVAKLEEKVKANKLDGRTGIAHTRWATHGKVSELNAHPHSTELVTIVHNGVIENYDSLKSDLQKNYNIKFHTETDTEVILNLLHQELEKTDCLVQSGVNVMKKLRGSFAVIAISPLFPEEMLVLRNGTPIGIGISKNESFIGSDAYSISPYCDNITFLNDRDLAVVKADKFEIYDSEGSKVKRSCNVINQESHNADKNNYEHFMLKEIHEEPDVAAKVISEYITNDEINMSFNNIDFTKIEKIQIIACGTSYYAGSTAKYWLEDITKIETSVEIASEYRSKKTFFTNDKTLSIFISQSGETADTLESLKIAKESNGKILSITNVEQSAIARNADSHFSIHAGPEIGVASTKAYLAQLFVLACIALKAADIRKTIDDKNYKILVKSITRLPQEINSLIGRSLEYKKIAQSICKHNSILFIGRNTSYPTAMEGALKLKELSYIHAEGIAGGELKHGSIALIDKNTPVFAIAPNDEYFEKISSNIHTVQSRGGSVILLSSESGCNQLKTICSDIIAIPETNLITMPLLYVIPLQLIAYHTALLKGHNVDQPRNLAKSVTVE